MKILVFRHFRLHASVIGMSSLMFARRFGFSCGINEHNCNLFEVQRFILSIFFFYVCCLFYACILYCSLQLCVASEKVMWFLETYVIRKEVFLFL